jgi:hypothetical protein
MNAVTGQCSLTTAVVDLGLQSNLATHKKIHEVTREVADVRSVYLRVGRFKHARMKLHNHENYERQEPRDSRVT